MDASVWNNLINSVFVLGLVVAVLTYWYFRDRRDKRR